MPSTKQPVTLLSQMGGVDSTTPAHMVSDNAWVRCHNMRPFRGKLEQVPRKVLVGALASCHPHEILEIVNLPIYRNGHGLCVALTKENAWQIHSTPSSSVKLGDVTGVLPFYFDSTYRRWSSVVYNDQVFFVNELNPVLACNGSRVIYLNPNGPKARYLVHYFDHLVLGWVDYNGEVLPGRMLWSDLYKFGTYDPSVTNEADHWDFAEDATGSDAQTGLTGLAKLGDTLFVYTSTSIRPVAYVGLPKVFRVGANLSGGIGNGLPYTLVSIGVKHFFFDTTEGTFFSFDGASVTPIGGPVTQHLLDTATSDPELLARTWGYHRPETQEVTWVFCSNQSAGEFDQAVTFNYRTGTWYTSSVEDVHSFGASIRRAIPVSELSGTVEDLEEKVFELSDGSLLTRLFGSSSGRLLREATTSDATSTLLAQEAPVLETKDYHFDQPQEMKEVDTISPYINYSAKVDVECAPRNLLTQSVEYLEPNVYDPRGEFLSLTTLRTAARIMRFRFTPQSVSGETTSSTNCAVPSPVPNGYMEAYIPFQVGKPPGSVTLSGIKQEYILNSYRAPHSQQYNYAYDDPGSADPYAISQSTGMLQDAENRSDVVLPPQGFDGVTKAIWRFASPAPGWPAAYWPGWGNKTPIPFPSGGWEVVVFGYKTSNNPTLPAYQDHGIISVSKTNIVPGTTGTLYVMSLRVRAIASLIAFTGGTNDGAYFQTGGTAADATHDLIRLIIGGTTYYLNRGAAATNYLKAIDYSVEINVTGGASMSLLLSNQDQTQFQADEHGRKVKIAGFAPTANLLARLDYTLRLASGTARTISTVSGGGVRDFKWTGITYNVFSQKAEK